MKFVWPIREWFTHLLSRGAKNLISNGWAFTEKIRSSCNDYLMSVFDTPVQNLTNPHVVSSNCNMSCFFLHFIPKFPIFVQTSKRLRAKCIMSPRGAPSVTVPVLLVFKRPFLDLKKLQEQKGTP